MHDKCSLVPFILTDSSWKANDCFFLGNFELCSSYVLCAMMRVAFFLHCFILLAIVMDNDEDE